MLIRYLRDLRDAGEHQAADTVRDSEAGELLCRLGLAEPVDEAEAPAAKPQRKKAAPEPEAQPDV